MSHTCIPDEDLRSHVESALREVMRNEDVCERINGAVIGAITGALQGASREMTRYLQNQSDDEFNGGITLQSVIEAISENGWGRDDLELDFPSEEQCIREHGVGSIIDSCISEARHSSDCDEDDKSGRLSVARLITGKMTDAEKATLASEIGGGGSISDEERAKLREEIRKEVAAELVAKLLG